MDLTEKDLSRSKHYKSKKFKHHAKIDNSVDYVFFWHTGSPFSNWHPAQYVYNEIEFNCSEQGVMWSKAKLFEDDEIAEQILQCATNQQKLMKSLGRQVKNFNESTWKKNRMKIYYDHCYQKFIQNSLLKEKLLDTGDKTLVEASPSDRIWGIGLNEKDARVTPPNRWPGTNLLGIILTNIKNELIELNE